MSNEEFWNDTYTGFPTNWDDTYTGLKPNEIPMMPETKTPADPVNHPSHYTDGNIEVIDFIEDKRLGFCLGNAVKYIARAGKKKSGGMSDMDKEIQDLEKAVWYVNRRIKELREARGE